VNSSSRAGAKAIARSRGLTNRHNPVAVGLSLRAGRLAKVNHGSRPWNTALPWRERKPRVLTVMIDARSCSRRAHIEVFTSQG